VTIGRVIAVSIGVLLTLSACSPASNIGTDVDGSWQLTHLEDSKGAVEQSFLDAVSLKIEGDTMTGQMPCNSYSGILSAEGGSIRISDMQSTIMACPDGSLEVRYLAALARMSQMSIGGDELSLTTDESEVAKFIRIEAPTGDH
jgi:heat shock protein HslJ